MSGVPVARFGLWLVLLAVAACGLRVGYVVVAKAGDDACGRELCGDANYYSFQAEVLANGDGFENSLTGEETADHPPLTALVATPAVWLPGEPVLPQRLTMVAVGTGLVVLIGLVGRSVAGDRAGLIAAGIAAVYPNLWMNDGLVMSESLTALGVATSLLLTYRLIRGSTVANAAWLGLVIGLTVLARAEVALYLPLVAIPVLWWARHLDRRQRIGRMAVVLATALGVIAPWAIYNTLRFEEPVTVSTNDGLTLLGANCEAVYFFEGTGLWTEECVAPVAAEGDQSEVSGTYRAAALDNAGDNLDRLPGVALARAGRVWSVYRPGQMATYSQGEGRERWASHAGTAMLYPLALAAVAGAVVLRRRRQPVWPLAATAVMVTVTAVATYGLTRFRVPAEVGVVVLAAVAIDALVRRWRSAHPEETAEVGAHDPLDVGR